MRILERVRRWRASAPDRRGPLEPIPVAARVRIEEPVAVAERGDMEFHRRSGSPALTAEDPELAVLISENEILAQRDNVLSGVIVTLASIGAILASGFIAEVPNLCSNFETPDPPQNCLAAGDEWLYLLVPVPVIALTGILVFLTMNSYLAAQMRSKVEAELRAKVALKLTAEREPPYGIPVPSSHRLSAMLASPRRSAELRWYKASNLIAGSAIIAVLLGLLVPAAVRANGWYAWGIVAQFVPAAVILAGAFLRASRTRGLFQDTADAAFGTRSGPSLSIQWLTPHPSTKRRPLSYVLLPRPLESVLKSVASVASFVVVFIATDSSTHAWWWGLVLVAGFELLLYQARYMFNDAIDLDVDQSSAFAPKKGRAPFAPRHRSLLRCFALARIVLFIVLILLVPGDGRGPALATVGVLVMMGVYDRFSEFARDRWGTTSPAEDWPKHLSPWPALLRLVFVSPGYGIRAVVGVWVAIDDVVLSPTVVAVFVAFSCLEAANVALGWALEGAADSSGQNEVRPHMARRPHIAWLTRHAGIVDRDARVVEPLTGGDLAAEPVLLRYDRVNGFRVWHLWAVISVAAAVGAGVGLNIGVQEASWDQVLTASAWGLGAAAVLLFRVPTGVRGARFVNPWLILPIWAAASLIVIRATPAADAWWPGVIVPAGVVVTYIGTRTANYSGYLGMVDDAKRVLLAFGLGVRRGARLVLGFFIGRDVWS